MARSTRSLPTPTEPKPRRRAKAVATTPEATPDATPQTAVPQEETITMADLMAGPPEAETPTDPPEATPETPPEEAAPRELTIEEMAREAELLSGRIRTTEAKLLADRKRMAELAPRLADALNGLGLEIHVSTGDEGFPSPQPSSNGRSSNRSSNRKDPAEMTAEEKKAVRAWLIERGWVNPRTGKRLGPMGQIPNEGYIEFANNH